MTDEKKAGDSGTMGCLILLALIVAGFLLLHWWVYNPNHVPRDRHGRPLTDDPYYDAPSGRTRGGDTY
jgi:hypothetical protein